LDVIMLVGATVDVTTGGMAVPVGWEVPVTLAGGTTVPVGLEVLITVTGVLIVHGHSKVMVCEAVAVYVFPPV
jgi:hypothetical protein